MKQIKLYIYSKHENSETVSHLPPTEYPYKQTKLRLVADDGFFLTNGEQYYTIIDVPNEDIGKWMELPKEDFKHLFEEEFTIIEDTSFSNNN